MTAYLQPGDHIHIACPISPVLYGDEVQREGHRLHAEYSAFYARYGITVDMTTTNSQLYQPVVVAVIRNQPEPAQS